MQPTQNSILDIINYSLIPVLFSLFTIQYALCLLSVICYLYTVICTLFTIYYFCPMVRIGKIAAAHGLQGALVLSHVIGNSKWLKKETVLFIELQKESFIPHFVKNLKATNQDEYIIQLDDVATVEQAKKLTGKQVYVQEEVLKKNAADSPLSWIGFKLVDRAHGDIGTIEDVMQTNVQWLAKLIYQNSEVLVPLIEQTITKIDSKAKTIFVDLPEGLLEVYL